MSYDIHNGEDYGYDKSYIVGIAYKEMTSVYYKDKKIDFKTANVKLNNEEIILTVWIMPFNNGEDINISDFSYQG